MTRRLWCFSAGGASGLDKLAGMISAAAELRMTPTAVAGSSAGAIAAAAIASGMSSGKLVELVAGLADSDFRDPRILWQLRPGLESYMSAGKIRRILERHLPANFRDLEMPCRIYATSEESGAQACMCGGNLRSAVLASMAVPVVWPAVEIDGVRYCDGGLCNYLAAPDPADIELYDEVWLFVCEPPWRHQPARRGLIARALTALHLLIHDQINDDLAMYSCDDRVRIVRSQLPQQTSMLRFDHSLIAASRADALAQLVLMSDQTQNGGE